MDFLKKVFQNDKKEEIFSQESVERIYSDKENKEKGKEGDKNNGYRLMTVLGDPQVGKTCFLNYFLIELRNLPHQLKENSTKGIKLIEFQEVANDIFIEFSPSDEHKISQSYFILAKSIFFILFDLSVDGKDLIEKNNLIKHLQFIQTILGSSNQIKVILIGTKLDLLQKNFGYFEKDRLTKEALIKIDQSKKEKNLLIQKKKKFLTEFFLIFLNFFFF